MSIFSKIFGDPNDRYIDSLKPTVEKINSLEAYFMSLTAEQLKAKSEEFKKQIAEGKTLEDILPEAFAAVREASRRVLGKRHFDVQLLGGMVLHAGKISEMKTGEGKTLVATLPAYLNALAGGGVHVVTVNDYLSRRDAVWMGQVYDALGLSVGCINHEASYLYDPKHGSSGEQKDSEDKERDLVGGFRVVHEFLRPVSRREAYEADITYGTNNEYGFDYLRDNMVYTTDAMAQRPAETHNYAIVDEVDSILIDEARTPLIISAPDEDSTKQYDIFAKVVPILKEGDDYSVDEKLKAIPINENGIEKVEKKLGIENIYAEGGVRYVHHLEQALKANVLFKKDKDYVVKNDEVIIVDEFTGRLMPGRRWSEGLHQAVEAKEGVRIQKESRTLATITFQNYFRLYKKLAGMTGTARSSAEELHKVYKLDVVAVPTNKPMARADQQDRIYKTELGKFKAIAHEIRERNQKGQPVLVGTVSIEKNELLSSILERERIRHNVLNAKNHEKEAEIIAQAGRSGGVTVATNMAGRGVDIILGGNPPDDAEAEKVRYAGGLHVIGTERHEARRIDDQLRGRAGRQGDPGSSQFFVSTEDEIVRIFGGDRLRSVMDTLGVGEEDVIENRFISNAIQQAQGKIEGHNFDIRKYVLEYDDVMNKHREGIYGLRKKVLYGDDSKDIVFGYLKDQIGAIVNSHFDESGQPDMKAIWDALSAMMPLSDGFGEFQTVAPYPEAMAEHLIEKAVLLYGLRENELGKDQMRQLEKMVLLRTVDEMWMDHIGAMEYLRDSVRLRAYGQRDPLVEYKLEGQRMFEELKTSIGARVAGVIFRVGFIQAPREVKMQEGRPDIGASPMEEEAKNRNDVKSEPVHVEDIGRNEPCPCGSGKKYKKCHGK